MSRSIIATLDLEQVLNLIQDNALRLTGANIGSIRLVDRERGRLRVEVSHLPAGVEIDEAWAETEIGEGITGRVAATGRPIIVNDVREDKTYLSYFQNMRSEISVPLVTEDEVIGVLSLESRREGAFDEDDQRLLTTLADLTVVAIQNAQQFEKLRKAQEAQLAAERMVMIGSLSTNFAHRMGGDTGIIRAWAQEIERKLSPDMKDSEFIHNALSVIIDTASRLNSWAVRMRKPIKPEVAERIDIHQLLESALSDVQIPSAIDIIRHYTDESIAVMAPSSQLTEALRVVIHNAADAMPDGGTLEITTSFSKIDVQNCLSIVIADSGSGVPKEHHATLFDLFFTTKQGQGMGYGLWWTKSFLEQSGGNIELVRSEVGMGSVFCIRLPV